MSGRPPSCPMTAPPPSYPMTARLPPCPTSGSIIGRPPAASRSRLDYGSATHVAGREKNEDFVGMDQTPTGLVAMLADGMGGGADGEVFSKLAVRTALANVRASKSSLAASEKLNRAFAAAIDAVRELKAGSERYKKSGTTLIGAVVEEDADRKVRLSVGNIGDSRAYLVDAQGEIECLTRDHTHYEDLVRQGVPPRRPAPARRPGD
ncbi:MAG: hypothetical protein HC884_08775 [Chloroflexaceae bacterium]|nr:hypothetical protein [Chloroflexaceae bacterium]